MAIQESLRNLVQKFSLSCEFFVVYNGVSLHGLGLAHTFDGTTAGAKYVYKHGSTDNIMDYSQYMKVVNVSVVDTQSLFHWQMQAINNNI